MAFVTRHVRERNALLSATDVQGDSVEVLKKRQYFFFDKGVSDYIYNAALSLQGEIQKLEQLNICDKCHTHNSFCRTKGIFALGFTFISRGKPVRGAIGRRVESCRRSLVS